MATISTRINSSGTYLVNGSFDEITYNRTSPVIKNLLISTEDFSQWVNVGHVITTNQAIAPDGSLTADRIQATTGSGGDYTAILNNSSVGGASYTFSFWVKSVSGATGTWGVNYYNGAHNRTTVPITGEWARQYITFTGTGGQFNVYIADNRTSLATITDAYVWGAQLERGTTPTIYQGIAAASTLVTPTFKNKVTSDAVYVTDIFDEVTYNTASPVIKNLLIYTDSFDNVNWGKGSVSITANSTTAPDGIIVADTIVENTTPSSYHFINQLFNKTATANTYTYSIYAKDAGRSGIGLRIDNNAGSGAVVTYNVATGAIILGAGTYGSFTSASSNILAVGNGWYRISLTATTDASTTVAFVQNYLHSIPAGTTVYTGDGISGIYIWGAQIEQNSTTTIYQGIAATNTLVAPGFAKRETSDGAVYVTGSFDEVTGIS